MGWAGSGAKFKVWPKNRLRGSGTVLGGLGSAAALGTALPGATAGGAGIRATAKC